MNFAVSADGVHWSLLSRDPLFPSLPLDRGEPITQRPGFCARLADRYLVCWSERNDRLESGRHIMATTTDFRRFDRIEAGLDIEVSDGAICPWRIGRSIALLSGPYLYEFDLS